MRQLADILEEKSKKVGGYAALGRLLGGLTGQAIGQYARGKGMPSFSTAIKWKEQFDENLIDLMFEGDVRTVEESDVRYGTDWKEKYIAVLEDLTRCRSEKEELISKMLPNEGGNNG